MAVPENEPEFETCPWSEAFFPLPYIPLAMSEILPLALTVPEADEDFEDCPVLLCKTFTAVPV